MNKEYPDALNKIEYMGGGWDCSAYLINNKDIFRISSLESPKRNMELYNKLNPLLPNLPLKRPIYKKLSLVNNSKYKVYSIYPNIPGKPTIFNKKTELLNLSITLSKIHSFSPPTDMFNDFNIINRLEEELKNLKEYVFNDLNKEEQYFIQKLYNDYINSAIPLSVIKKFVHGDLHNENIISKGNVITGIIDWDDMGYDDPITDFAKLPFEIFERLIETYPNKNEILGKNIKERYLFNMMRNHIYSLFYSSYFTRHKDKHENHLKQFIKAIKIYNKIHE